MDKKRDEIVLSKNLARLRKEAGITQEELANQLFVSDKTISKWERGTGIPEVSQLIKLAKFFNTTIDDLLLEDRIGIAIAGNIIIDQVKTVDSYPKPQMLSSISNISQAAGGCVTNTIIDIAIMDPSMNLSAVGRIGKDEAGDYLLKEFKKYHIDTRNISYSEAVHTSFSDVMSVEGTGERTFFHYRGANAEFSPENIDLSALNCKMLHVGYILLLDKFDEADPEYGTVMARFLAEAQSRGIKTSVDVVSSNDDLYREKVLPALKYCDNVVMNEIEGCSSAGICPRNEDGSINLKNVKEAMKVLKAQGVKERVILHAPELGICLNAAGQFTVVPSLQLPKGYIKGSVGAGDAFAAGCLYGIYNELDDKTILELASGAAACNLAEKDAISGMKSRQEIEKFMSSLKRQPLPKE